MTFQSGDEVYRLNQNGKPMMASNGAYLLRGVVVEWAGDSVKVRWIAQGAADPAITYDSPANLQLVKETRQ